MTAPSPAHRLRAANGKALVLNATLKRLTYANVISTIALFVALGGGYAVAFSGSGSLQKGAWVGPPTVGQVTVRSLTGIGALNASCTEGGIDTVNLQLTNGSGEPLSFRWGDTQGNDGGNFVQPNEQEAIEPLVGGQSNLRLHIFPTDGTKRPQASLDINVGGGDDCPEKHVTVLALNTEQ